jgi:hypothetical protein
VKAKFSRVNKQSADLDSPVDATAHQYFHQTSLLLAPTSGSPPSNAIIWSFRMEAVYGDNGRCAAAIYTLIATAKLNNVDPQAWLADVLARLPDHPAKRIHELLPWNWRPQSVAHAA